MKILIAVLPVLAGFILDCIIGDPYWLPHPVRLIGKQISWLEKLIRKKMKNNLIAGGIILNLTTVLLSGGISFAVLYICYRFNIWLGAAVESVMCFQLIAAKCLKTESMKVYTAIEQNDIEEARKAVSMIVGRDTAVLDDKGIIRAAVETVAENASDGVTAPLFYIMLGGAPLGFVYKAANTLDSMVGYWNEKYRQIGWFSAKLDDILNYIPSRFTALLMIAAAPVLGLNGKNAFKIWRRDRLKHASPNSAQTESACAGALMIRLAGDAYYFGELHKKPYIGDNCREVECRDIIRANRLMYGASTAVLIIGTVIRAVIFGGII